MITKIRKHAHTLSEFCEKHFHILCGLLFIWETFFSFFIVKKVAYTEIDWVAYMQEVEGYLNGDTNYENLRGDTGPLVYPAGFVYIYSALYYLTGKGENILLAQNLFVGLYVLTLAVVVYIYRKGSKAGSIFWIGLLCVSKRIHSIFMLRLFNDCFMALFAYLMTASILNDQWSLGCVLFSLSLSVKGSGILYFPGLSCLLTRRFGFFGATKRLFIVIFVQIAVGSHFLFTYPMPYLLRSFPTNKVYEYKWSLNMQFISEEFFLDPLFGKIMLLLLVLAYLAAVFLIWTRPEGLFQFLQQKGSNTSLPSTQIVDTLFFSNFVGFIFMKSLHYQFYVWIFHCLPHLISMAGFEFPFAILLMGFIEIMWNLYPPQEGNSYGLWTAHLTIFFGILYHTQKKQKAS